MTTYEKMTADEIIEALKSEYKDDTEALEVIEMAEKNIEYIKKQKDYSGQTPKQCALGAADHLKMWN